MADEDENDDDKKFEERFNKLFHKASKDREARFEKRITENLTKTLGETLGKSMTDKLEELRKVISDDGDGKPDDKKPGALSPEIEATIRQAQKDAADAKAESAKLKAAAEEANKKAERGEERQSLVSKLSGKIKPALFDMVIDNLHQKHVTRDPDTGKMLWKNSDDEFVPFEAGVDAWEKSDAAKELAPPRQAGGSGGGGPKGQGSGTGQMTTESLGALISARQRQ